jgi:hypothetical protein
MGTQDTRRSRFRSGPKSETLIAAALLIAIGGIAPILTT